MGRLGQVGLIAGKGRGWNSYLPGSRSLLPAGVRLAGLPGLKKCSLCLSLWKAGPFSPPPTLAVFRGTAFFLARVVRLTCFHGDSAGKESACTVGDLCLIPGLGRSPGGGKGSPPQYSCLEHPVDRGTWRAAVHGVTKSQTRLSSFHLGSQKLDPSGSFSEWPPQATPRASFFFFCNHEVFSHLIVGDHMALHCMDTGTQFTQPALHFWLFLFLSTGN